MQYCARLFWVIGIIVHTVSSLINAFRSLHRALAFFKKMWKNSEVLDVKETMLWIAIWRTYVIPTDVERKKKTTYGLLIAADLPVDIYSIHGNWTSWKWQRWSAVPLLFHRAKKARAIWAVISEWAKHARFKNKIESVLVFAQLRHVWVGRLHHSPLQSVHPWRECWRALFEVEGESKVQEWQLN